MREGHHKVARAYVLYREERAKERAKANADVVPTRAPTLHMQAADGSLLLLDETRLSAVITEACTGFGDVSAQAILIETNRNLYDGISQDELALAPILAARTFIETEPNYTKVSARLLLDKLRREALSFLANGTAKPRKTK
jgi:ribonucleoside-diphosphate reductase alpha chain